MRYEPVDGCYSATIEGVTVVLTPELEYVELDGTGTAIWDALCAEGSEGTVADVARRLALVFDAEADQMRPDVERYLTELAELGLARRAT